MADSFWNHLENTIGADRLTLTSSCVYEQPAQVNNQIDDIDPWRKNATIEDWKRYLFSTSSYQTERPVTMGLESVPRCGEVAKVQNTNGMLNPSHSVSVDIKQSQGGYIPFSVPKTFDGGYTSKINGKRERTIYTPEQVAALEKIFHVKPYVTREERQSLEKRLKISDDAIKVWFQNRRTKGKKEPSYYPSSERSTYYPPSEKSTYNPSSERSTYYPPSEKSTYNPSSERSTCYPPSEKSTYNPSSERSTYYLPSEKSTYNPSSERSTYYPPSERSTYNPSSERSTYYPPSEKSTYYPPSERSTYYPPSERSTYYPPSERSTYYPSSVHENRPRDPLAHVESLLHKPDKYGYVRLDDRAISELVTAIDRCLPKDLNLQLLDSANVVKEEKRSCVSERVCGGSSTNLYYHQS